MNKFKYSEGTFLEEIEEGTLYHYTDSSGLLGILTNQSLWVTKSNFLNDRMEISYIDEVIKVVMNKLFSPSDANVLLKLISSELSYLRGINDNALKAENYYICSLSTNSDSLTLWSEYSNQYGYNIGFDVLKLRKILDDTEGEVPLNIHGKVIYDFEHQCSLIIDEMKKTKIIEYKNKGQDENLKEEVKHFSVVLLLHSFFLKSPVFAQEEEYRIIFFQHNQLKGKKRLNNEIHFRDRIGVFLPYIKVPLIDQKSKLPIQRITIGPKHNIDIAEQGLELFLLKNNYDDVELIRSSIPLRF